MRTPARRPAPAPGVTRATAVGLALAGLAAAVARPSIAAAISVNTDPATPNDRTALGFMHLAETLQIALYEAGPASRLRPATRRFVTAALAQERAHLATLEAINRRHAVDPDRPSVYDFAFAGETQYLRTLARVEAAVIAGYGGVIVGIEAPSVYLADLVPIVADEMAQASVIAALLDADSPPAAFTDPRPPAAIKPILDDPQSVGG
jgi:hypothetical protein